MSARREWAETFLAAANGAVPEYGSPEWVALPHGPEKVASAVRAAEDWLVECRFAELDQHAREAYRAFRSKDADDASWRAAGRAHSASWDSRAGQFKPCPQIAAEVAQEWVEWARGEAA
ncbi:MAG: hypothetical protein WA966_01335 [Ornithinimicrobium sp.]